MVQGGTEDPGGSGGLGRFRLEVMLARSQEIIKIIGKLKCLSGYSLIGHWFVIRRRY